MRNIIVTFLCIISVSSIANAGFKKCNANLWKLLKTSTSPRIIATINKEDPALAKVLNQILDFKKTDIIALRSLILRMDKVAKLKFLDRDLSFVGISNDYIKRTRVSFNYSTGGVYGPGEVSIEKIANNSKQHVVVETLLQLIQKVSYSDFKWVLNDDVTDLTYLFKKYPDLFEKADIEKFRTFRSLGKLDLGEDIMVHIQRKYRKMLFRFLEVMG